MTNDKTPTVDRPIRLFNILVKDAPVTISVQRGMWASDHFSVTDSGTGQLLFWTQGSRPKIYQAADDKVLAYLHVTRAPLGRTFHAVNGRGDILLRVRRPMTFTKCKPDFYAEFNDGYSNHPRKIEIWGAYMTTLKLGNLCLAQVVSVPNETNHFDVEVEANVDVSLVAAIFIGLDALRR